MTILENTLSGVNELDILKLRMEIMDPIVDKFVIEEAAYTFSSEAKPLYFQENREMFKISPPR